MAESINKVQYRMNLDACCGKVPTKPKRLTGIAKQAIEDSEAAEFWNAIRQAEEKEIP